MRKDSCRKEKLMTAPQEIRHGLRTIASDIASGFLEIMRNGFALLGLAVVFAGLVLLSRADLRHSGEQHLIGWLQARQAPAAASSDAGPAPAAEPAMMVRASVPTERATATDPRHLPRQQAAIAYWLSKKYRVAPEPVSTLVAEAFAIGRSSKLDPTLILAIVAIESGFNPFAQSPVGAQGLMQVMTRVHSDKYIHAGGDLAAFDPVTNLRVGVKVLQECIDRAGSIEGGLRHYVGAANIPDDGGYSGKVLAEHARLQAVATIGKAKSPRATTVAAPTAVPTPAAGASASASESVEAVSES
jgi:hypothetical protein